MFKIGDAPTNIFLAPMAGVNCSTFRLMCERYGSGINYTQMIDAETISPELIESLIDRREKRLIVQLIGSKPESLRPRLPDAAPSLAKPFRRWDIFGGKVPIHVPEVI